MVALLNRARPAPGRFHEVYTADGSVRPHWQRLAETIGQMSAEQIQRRDDMVAAHIQKNGVTLNALDEQSTLKRWRVGAIPSLIAEEEWQQISAGMVQRADLLNRVAADIYGEQALLQAGLLPPELIYGHPSYMASCRHIRPPRGCYVHLYAADLVRTESGQWCVVADRTQAPSGAGYALENRQIVARAFPDAFRQLGVQSLSPFFDQLQNTIKRQAPCDNDSPLMVLLSPGRFHEAYFEHVYLARQLGIPLVESHDLTVRQPYVYLKTLSGLRRVHAIYRRLNDIDCDPLELSNSSALGVPGLLGVARAGQVVIANALGSGVLESQALLGFLPAIAQHWGEPSLLLPSTSTWWCGEDAALADALTHFDDLVIKPTYPTQSMAPVFTHSLNSQQRQDLIARIRQRPYVYVAQERMPFGQVPMWDRQQQQFLAHSSALRLFAVATEQGYVVMPGGLTRVSASAGEHRVSMEQGGISKDTWVCLEQSPRRTLPQSRRILVRDLRRADPYLPSRFAENLFWFGRYAERTEHHARLLRSALNRQMSGELDEATGLAMAIHHGQALEMLSSEGPVLDNLLQALRSDDSQSPDLRSTLRALVYNAGEVQSYLSQENWSSIVALEQEVRELNLETLDTASAVAFLDRLLSSLSALSGFAHDDMTQDLSWRFLLLGHRLERLQGLSLVMVHALATPAVQSSEGLDWLLEIGNSRITYRLRYLAHAQLLPVFDLLMLDPSNPHALSFQLAQLRGLFSELNSRDYPALIELEKDLMSLDLTVLESDLAYPERLQRSLTRLATLMQKIHDDALALAVSVERQFFAHIEDRSRTLSSV